MKILAFKQNKFNYLYIIKSKSQSKESVVCVKPTVLFSSGHMICKIKSNKKHTCFHVNCRAKHVLH